MQTFVAAMVAVVGALAGVGIGLVLAGRWGARAVVDPAVGELRAQVAAQSAELRRLADAEAAGAGGADRLKQSIDHTLRAVEELRVREEQRRERESESFEVVRRLSTVLAGGTDKGRAGENVLQGYFADLPPDMLVTDFRVNGKVVEFGLRLPDGRCLPVDSKWSAVAELEALESNEDPAERTRLAAIMEREVARRAKEVAQYLDPSLTSPVALAAIPDPVYEVLRKAHTDAYRSGVVIVPYSFALPVLLFLHSLVSRYGRAGDLQACLSDIGSALGNMEQVLENKLTRAATMLQNGNDELRGHIGKARGSIAGAGIGPEAPREPRLEADGETEPASALSGLRAVRQG